MSICRAAACLRGCALLGCVLLAACNKPAPPPTEQPPVPKADAHTQLRDAIKQPLDKAKGAEQSVQDAADAQRAAIDAAGG